MPNGIFERIERRVKNFTGKTPWGRPNPPPSPDIPNSRTYGAHANVEESTGGQQDIDQVPPNNPVDPDPTHAVALPVDPAPDTRINIVTGGYHIINHQGIVHIRDSQDDFAWELRELFGHTVPDAINMSAEVASQDLCLDGTRAPTLHYLTNHATSTDPALRDVLWLHGPAGSGKSTIMRTLAKTTHPTPRASFFFRRRAPEEQNLVRRRFIPTLAYQMSRALPATRLFIAQAVRDDHAVFTEDMRVQCQTLLEVPFINAATRGGQLHPSLFLILVDGLDEAGSPDDVVEIIKSLAVFVQAVGNATKSRIKVIIASRPDFDLRRELQDLEGLGVAQAFELDTTDAGLDLYYHSKFQKIRIMHFLPKTWPTSSQTRQLLVKTSGQYAFATVATRYTAAGDPERNLERILSTDILEDNPASPFLTLDQLYAFIFLQIPDDLRRNILGVVGFILDDGISAADLIVDFLSLPNNFVHRLSLYLSSLFRVQEDITPYHASLADFLFTRERSERFGLYVPPSQITALYVKAFKSLLVRGVDNSRFLYSRVPDDRLVDFVMEAALASSTLATDPPNLHAEEYGCKRKGIVEFLRVADVKRLDPLSIVLLRSYELDFAHPQPAIGHPALIKESRRRTAMYDDIGGEFHMLCLYLRVWAMWAQSPVDASFDPAVAEEIILHTVNTTSVTDRQAWNLFVASLTS